MEGKFQRTLPPRKGPWSQLACPWHSRVLLPPENVRSWASSADASPSKAAGRGQWEQEATCKHLRKEGGGHLCLGLRISGGVLPKGSVHFKKGGGAKSDFKGLGERLQD